MLYKVNSRVGQQEGAAVTHPKNIAKTRPSHWLLGRQVLHQSHLRRRTKPTKGADPELRHSRAVILIACVRSWQEEVQSEEEMARRRALLLEKQQKRTEELKKRRQWHEQERESR